MKTWQERLVEVLERTYEYDATLMTLATGTSQYSDDYKKRLEYMKAEGGWKA